MKKKTKIKLKCKEESNGEILSWKEKEVKSKNSHMRGKEKGKKVHMKNKDRKILTNDKDKDSKHLHSNEIMREEQTKIQDKALAAKKGNFSNQDRSKKVQKRKVLLINVQVCKTICWI